MTVRKRALALFALLVLTAGCAASTDKAGAPAEEEDTYLLNRARKKPASSAAEAETSRSLDGATAAPAPGVPKGEVLGIGGIGTYGHSAGDDGGRSRPPASAGVKAGVADDNKQFNHYLEYLAKYQGIGALENDVSDRRIITALDAAGRSLPNCRLAFRDREGRVVAERRTYADGRALFFPSEGPELRQPGIEIQAVCGQESLRAALDQQGRSQVELRFQQHRPSFDKVPVDILFVLDTTGSMDDEIVRLRQTIEVIQFQVAHLPTHPQVRFGMVLYRDRGEEYLTRKVPFTADEESFRRALDRVQAAGGGDTPEDVEEGLRVAVEEMDWRDDGLRLAFLLGDAPPHLDREEITYLETAREAARRGIKFATIGASGLDTRGEYIWRQVAQYTMGLFVFLTYGETGESEGGTPSSVSHHTGANWSAQNLETIVVRMVQQEMSHLTDTPPATGDDYYVANPVGDDPDKDAILAELLGKGIKQLRDFSLVKLDPTTPTVVLPLVTDSRTLTRVAGLLDDRLLLSVYQTRAFHVLERTDLQPVLEELARQGESVFEDFTGVEVGKLKGAEQLVMGRLKLNGDHYELFLKLVRLETGEVLSVALLKAHRSLFTEQMTAR